jgi:hypothetical protein
VLLTHDGHARLQLLATSYSPPFAVSSSSSRWALPHLIMMPWICRTYSLHHQESFYETTRASKFVRAGFSPAVVNLALAFHATNRGDESQVRVCVPYRTHMPSSCCAAVEVCSVWAGAAAPLTHAGHHVTCAESALPLLPIHLPLVSQIVAFCERYMTLTREMAFPPSLAAGALLRSCNDLAAAANLITELS